MPLLRPRLLTWVTIAFFTALLITGLAVYKDYGISWDEIATRELAILNVTHAIPDRATLDAWRSVKGEAFERFGPLFDMMLVSAERVFAPTTSRALMEMRHLLNFLAYYLGVVMFYVFCRRRFTSGIALLATVCLVASPPLFSHAFYNTKDISFFTAFLGAMLTLDTVLRRPAWHGRLNHLMTTVLVVGTRVLGLFAVLLTAAAAIARRPRLRTVLELAAYVVLVGLLLPLVWPVLRIDPIGVAKGAVFGSTANFYSQADLFRGRLIAANQLPRDYIVTWILITTPLVISALFLAGTVWLAASFVKRPRVYLFGGRQRDLIVLCWFFGPVMGTVILRPVMYDAWRHLFFVYPAFVYIAGIGMEVVATRARARWPTVRRSVIHGWATAALLLLLAPAVAFMIESHPYEHLYFNRLAGRDMAEIKQRFELDYWGLSYRPALEYIVRTDASPVINVSVANYPGVANSLMLSPHDQARLHYVSSNQPADYFVTNYRFHPGGYGYPNEVFRVRVGNATINSVFRLSRAAR
jgi:hypothetical protein